MKILGIDPGSVVTGYALIETSAGRVRLIRSGTVKPVSNQGFAGRLGSLQSQLDELISELSPEEAAVEDLFHSINARSALRLAHARGVILSALARAGLSVAEYTPLQVKKAVGGHGLSDKDSLRRLLERLLDARAQILSRDASDAVAVAMCHAQALPYRAAVDRATRSTGAAPQPASTRPGAKASRSIL